MKLTLIIHGERRTYYSRGLNARASLTAYEMAEELDERAQNGTAYTPEHIERMTTFVVDLFDRQFTEDELLDGYTDSFFTLFPPLLHATIQGVNAAMQDFPPAAQEPKTTAALKPTRKKTLSA